ncbi:carboxylate-amine ligase [Nakamurella flavida]|uniref:carboxylate-amine ligase n=1 Tax=Nakamurella flavida TaxID=363630 RepID=UPI002786C5FC|nr:glutamate--cysteine ligase [Nakamurella flavida]MDP9778450.1 carboxylate-amine ligase [Nakamurella flavida]
MTALAPVDAAPGPIAARHSRLGVEEEFHLVDPETGEVRPGSEEVLAALPAGERYKAELMASAVETNSAVAETLADLRADVAASRAELVDIADRCGYGVIAAGAAPLTGAVPIPIMDGKRYSIMQQDYRMLADEQLICGLQVHVDCPDRDLGIRAMNRLQPWLPLLLALSASSPYWQGRDTGYASYRSLLWSRWPTTGPAPQVSGAAAYDALVELLVDSGVAHDPGMIYFDSRAAINYPTIEIRIADSVPLVDDLVLVAGLGRALVRRCIADVERGAAEEIPPVEVLNVARWRAARSGLTGPLLDPRTFRPVAPQEAMLALLEHVREFSDAEGDTAELTELTAATLADGGSAARQRRAVAETGDVRSAVAVLRRETAAAGRGSLVGDER